MSQQENPFRRPLNQNPLTGKWGETEPEAPALPPMLFLMLIPIVLIGSVFMIPVFPIAATIAAILGYVFEIVVGMIWNPDQWALWTMMGLVMMVAIYLALPIENRVARASGSYRYARHWIRVVGLALMINEIGIPWFCQAFGIYQDAPPWGLLYGVTADKLIRIAIIAVIVHVLFRLIDTRGRGLRFYERIGPPKLRKGRFQ